MPLVPDLDTKKAYLIFSVTPVGSKSGPEYEPAKTKSGLLRPLNREWLNSHAREIFMFEMTLFRPHHATHDALADFERDFFRDFAPPFSSGAALTDRATRWSAVEVSETEQAVVMTLDIPGVEQKDLDIKVEGDTLTAKAEGARPFTRQYTLPDTIDAEKTAAALKNGVLTITLPKRESAKPKTIQVQIA